MLAPTTTFPFSSLLGSSKVVFKSESVKLPDDLPIPSEDVVRSVRKTDATSSDERGIEKKNVGVRTSRIQFVPIGMRNLSETFSIEDGELYDKDEHELELQRYKMESLNADQRKIWDYVSANPTNIIMIQAGPGCGKSYTLKTIAYNMRGVKFDTIIYKHDLLASFKYNSRRYTVAKFIMKTLRMTFFEYKAFDKLLSSKITAYEFMLLIVSMLKKATLPNLKGGIVLLDEYTIISKPLLLVVLMLLEHYKIGAIVCGDRNQLQNIFNSRHATLSSHKLAASFASERFTLHKNERCSDAVYNDIIAYISQFSSNRKLDGFAYALIAAIFLRQLIEPPNYNQVHLAGTHQELSDLAHKLVCQNCYPTDFYTIDQSRLRDKDFVVRAKASLQPTKALIDYQTRIEENQPARVDKFLPYIPLVVGARYYVFKHSEYCQGVLEAVQPDDTVRLKLDNGATIVVGRNTNDEVIFDQHREFLLNRESGRIYAYPIYPANFMSIHKCQGCTITENLDLMLNNTQYQGLYVALSRVTNPNQISRVTIPDQISYIISTIINFPQHAENRPITVDDLKRGLENYVFYNVNSDMTPFLTMISDFILSDDVQLKRSIREQIITLAKNYPQSLVSQAKTETDTNSNLLTMSLVIKYRDVFVALACLDEIDRNVWVHEYILANSELSCLLPQDFQPNSQDINRFEVRELNELIKMADLNNTYTMETSTLKYIETKCHNTIRMSLDDRKKHEKFVISARDEYTFSECTEFCAKVYKKLTRGEKISESWLIDELNYMLTMCQNSTTSQPEKVNADPEGPKRAKMASMMSMVKRPRKS
nr:dnahel 2 [Oryctes rhinoceros nudivirus]